MELTIRNGLLLLIAFQSLLFSFILFTHKKGPKRISNRLLGLFLFTLSLQMVCLLFFNYFEAFQPFASVFGFFYGPFLYLYATSLIYSDFKWVSISWIHFAPGLLLTILASSGINLIQWTGPMMYVSLTVYISIIFIQLKKYKQIIRSTTSTNLPVQLNWLQWTIISFSLVLMADLIDQILPLSTPKTIDELAGVMVFVLVLYLINGMFYKGLKHPHLFLGISQEDVIRNNNPIEFVLTEENKNLLQKLEKHMVEKRPYLKPDLTLHQLADSLDVPSRQLSTIINQYLNQNFVDYINTFRIERAKKRLANPKDEKETIMEVMYDVGFNSKSSFNTIFRVKTGHTPTEYKNKFKN